MVDSFMYFPTCATLTTSFRWALADRTTFTDAWLLVGIKITGFHEWWKWLLHHSDTVCLLVRAYTYFTQDDFWGIFALYFFSFLHGLRWFPDQPSSQTSHVFSFLFVSKVFSSVGSEHRVSYVLWAFSASILRLSSSIWLHSASLALCSSGLKPINPFSLNLLVNILSSATTSAARAHPETSRHTHVLIKNKINVCR